MPTRVAVYHPEQIDRYMEALRSRLPALEFIPAHDEVGAEAAIGNAEILLAHMSFPTQVLGSASRLRWVQVMAAGVEPWMAAIPDGIRLSRVTGSFGRRMAEYAIGYILAVTQRIPELLRNQDARRWEPLDLDVAHRHTLGVAGLGSIGGEVVRLGNCLGMPSFGYSRRPPDDLELVEWFGPDQFSQFMASADFIVLALPATTVTRNLVDQAALQAMRQGAWLINIARGDIVDEQALINGLQVGRPAGAILDVFTSEPLSANSPLWSMPNVIVTPHHSGATVLEEVVDLFETNLARFRSGQPLINEVDPARGY